MSSTSDRQCRQGSPRLKFDRVNILLLVAASAIFWPFALSLLKQAALIVAR